jgi:penicillin-binding protein 2
MSIRLRSVFYITVIIFFVFLFRLFQLQILDGNKYRELSEGNRLKIVKIPAVRGILYDRKGTPLVKNIPYFSVSLISENSKNIDITALSKLLGMKNEEIIEKINKRDNSPFVPVKLKQGLSFEEIARIEARRSDFPGLSIEVEASRQYPYGKIGAHVIGYLGKIGPNQVNNKKFKDLPPNMLIGQWGAEAIFDEELRGISGEKIIEIDALGRELRKLQESPSVKGNDIYLSIDIDVQKAAEESFINKAGAVVAIKPDSGEILALASLPSFDPNLFASGISYETWKSLLEDTKKPMLNRAVQSQYPPGSVFKIITAIAALEEGVVGLNEKIFCRGGINYGRWTFGCWRKGGHGFVDLHKAIVESCDVFFYEIGRRLGIDKIYKYASAFGLGKETGINLVPIKEKKGLIPNTDWKRQKKGLPWYLGDTFISSIGQGFITTTPIQMALMTSTIVNGGNFYKPSLVKGDKNLVKNISIKPQTIEIIKKALSGVVNEPNGTATGARSSITFIGGKTGTAQVVGKKKGLSGEKFMDHAWFVAFAPLEKPEIALSVFVENGGSGGAVAAPIAKRVIEAYLKSQNSEVINQRSENAQD